MQVGIDLTFNLVPLHCVLYLRKLSSIQKKIPCSVLLGFLENGEIEVDETFENLGCMGGKGNIREEGEVEVEVEEAVGRWWSNGRRQHIDGVRV